jgi:hypothetical protein
MSFILLSISLHTKNNIKITLFIEKILKFKIHKEIK